MKCFIDTGVQFFSTNKTKHALSILLLLLYRPYTAFLILDEPWFNVYHVHGYCTRLGGIIYRLLLPKEPPSPSWLLDLGIANCRMSGGNPAVILRVACGSLCLLVSLTAHYGWKIIFWRGGCQLSIYCELCWVHSGGIGHVHFWPYWWVL